jgi:hypothetical protein
VEDGDWSAGVGSEGFGKVENRLTREGLWRVLSLGLSCRAAIVTDEK